MNTPRPAVAYLRVSTDEQNLGPEAQLTAIRTYCAARGLELVAVHEDRVSGAAPLDERMGLMAALQDVEQGRAAVVVAAKRDRIARDSMLAALIERECERLGGALVTADGAAEGAGPESVLMRRILDAFAEYERAMIRARTKAALTALAAQGVKLGRPAYGTTDGERALVARAVELREQGLTLAAVVETMTAEGFTARNGAALSIATVHRITKRAAVAA
jgi:DNA invertase Pin-like site-specific DNA recombinase